MYLVSQVSDGKLTISITEKHGVNFSCSNTFPWNIFADSAN